MTARYRETDNYQRKNTPRNKIEMLPFEHKFLEYADDQRVKQIERIRYARDKEEESVIEKLCNIP
jgi:hypothetical protein